MQDASLSKSSGGDVRVFFEDFIEICSVIKATFKSDIKDIHIGGFDNRERFLYALENDIEFAGCFFAMRHRMNSDLILFSSCPTYLTFSF